jgi:hypothetical protein
VHPEIAPGYTVPPAAIDRLHTGLFSGKSRRKMRPWALPSATVARLAFGKDAIQKAGAAPVERGIHTLDLGHVDASTD